jgi:hypothetical protein
MLMTKNKETESFAEDQGVAEPHFKDNTHCQALQQLQSRRHFPYLRHRGMRQGNNTRHLIGPPE